MWVDTSSSILRLLVPKKWRRRVFAAIHELAHPGIWATSQLIGGRYVWPQLAKDVSAWCRDCTTCQAAKVTRHHTAEVQPIPMPVQHFTHLHLDLVGPLPASPEGFSYIFTIVDRTTRRHEEAGNQASNVNCLPPPMQRDGGESALAANGCLKGKAGRQQLARPPALGAVRPQGGPERRFQR
jgi:hypothetical protein